MYLTYRACVSSYACVELTNLYISYIFTSVWHKLTLNRLSYCMRLYNSLVGLWKGYNWRVTDTKKATDRTNNDKIWQKNDVFSTDWCSHFLKSTENRQANRRPCDRKKDREGLTFCGPVSNIGVAIFFWTPDCNIVLYG